MLLNSAHELSYVIALNAVITANEYVDSVCNKPFIIIMNRINPTCLHEINKIYFFNLNIRYQGLFTSTNVLFTYKSYNFFSIQFYLIKKIFFTKNLPTLRQFPPSSYIHFRKAFHCVGVLFFDLKYIYNGLPVVKNCYHLECNV